MKVLIWIATAIFTSEWVHGDSQYGFRSDNSTDDAIEALTPAIIIQLDNKATESNPYREALLARPWESVQDYVTVRPGAHMFYWLYYADGTRVGALCKPLIIWIQGGPGYAASGIANFAEIGPLTMNMEPRNHTWVKGRNVLLFDHPVGTGFSYVSNNSLLAKTEHEVATDLVKAIEKFLKIHKGFRKTPTYIFGQRYGGKICPRLAYYLHTEIEKKNLKMNLKGIGIGSGLVDPIETILTYPKFLYNSGIMDQNAYLHTTSVAAMVRDFFNEHDYTAAAKLVHNIFLIMHVDVGLWINFNNINQTNQYPARHSLQRKMNTYVKPTLSPEAPRNLEWVYMSDEVHHHLNKNLLVPSTKYLEMLLNETKLKVAVYNGNLDAITPLAGASNWVHKLKWHGSNEFERATRHQIGGTNNGFYKETKQLSLWSVFGAGVWVPEDNPEAMEQILEHIMFDNVKT